MTIDITINKSTYNALKLDEDLRAALADKIAGVSTVDDRVTVHFHTAPSEADRALAQQVIAEHNAADKTEAQAVDAAERVIIAELVAQAAAAITTIDADIAALPTADITAIKAMFGRSLQRERKEIQAIVRLAREVLSIN